MSIKAMKQALEALEKIDGAMPFPIGRSAITALRAAIEQAEKPVAWRHEKFYEGSSGWFYADWHSEGLNPPSAQLLYTTPPAAPVQEPVCDKDPRGCWSVRCQLEKKCKNTPPAAPRQWVGLTAEEMNGLIDRASYMDETDCQLLLELAEAKLKEKNAA